MITLSHPTGNSFVRHALNTFHQNGLLHSFHTTVAWNKDWSRLIPFPSVVRQLERRSYPNIPMSKIHTQSFPEVFRLTGLVKDSNAIEKIYTQVDKSLAGKLEAYQKAGVKAVYAYEDGAKESFSRAKVLGLCTLYDLPIGHYKAAQKVFQEEAQLNPAWAATLTGLQDSAEKLAKKDEELHLADHIIVASSFTASTLKGIVPSDKKISVIPYGTPPSQPFDELNYNFKSKPKNQRLKVLYVGSLTQRKGISYLLQAAATLGNKIELTLVGRQVVSAGVCPALDKILSGQGEKNRNIRHISSLPHGDILDLMRQSNILVFPSLFEGFGLVLTEALSCGLPIIATNATAAPDIIQDGVEGFIIPTRSSDAIAEKLEWALEHPAELAQMRRAAYNTAQNIGWSHYEKSLIMLATSYVK